MKSEKSKRVKKVFLIIACIFIIFLAVTFLINKLLLSKEKQMLTEAGYYNPVSVGDYSLNVYDFGNKEGTHTFVGISGRGVFDYSVRMDRLMGGFADDNRIVVVDRPGYGLSDDTKEPLTVESIVDDYRTALINAGIEAPYILLPHSIGSAYATYWVSKYPEEIEGYIQGIPYIGEVIVQGLKNEKGDEYSLLAEVYLSEESGDKTEREVLEDIMKALSELPSYKQVSKVMIRKEPFPKTSTNKIKRNYT